MLPPDAPISERMLWAGLAAIVGCVHDGSASTDVTKFQRLEAACRTFGVPPENFDALAKRLGFFYYRPWDCYLGREAWTERTRADLLPNGSYH